MILLFLVLLGQDTKSIYRPRQPERANPHIHLHALATDGAFDGDGVFHPMPFDMQGDVEVLTRLFAKRVLDLMVRRKAAKHTAPRRDADLGAQRVFRGRLGEGCGG